jgi:3-isopropylmalate/(R)-2-methylmalate dehydratase large subunit
MNDILQDESLTFAEKVLNLKKIDQVTKKAGDIIIASVDLTLAQDSTGPLAIKVLKDMGVQKVKDPKKILLFLDHSYPAPDIKIANLHDMMRAFSFQQGCHLVEGSISHQYVLENYATPGMLLIGADSHTCQAGCVGAFATGMGSTEVASIWASGKIWMEIPESFKINISGKLPKGVFARDIILKFIGDVGEDGGNYKSLEWHGAVDQLSIESRAAICNNAMECGCKNSVFFVDKKTKDYLHHVRRNPIAEIHPGKKAEYKKEFEIELDKLQPLVAAPDNVDNVKTVEEVAGAEFDQAFIGSSTNGRLEDIEITAKILHGKKVSSKCRLIVTPASMAVYRDAIDKGYVKTILEAGGVFTNATCGACVGTHLGVLGKDEICISSSPRNYVGRMGDSSSKIFLASPATCAASAIEGKIADPRDYL